MNTRKKIKKAILFIVLSAICVSVIFTGCGKDVPIEIVNGDFETTDAMPAGWEISDYENDYNEDPTASDVTIAQGKDGLCVSIENNIPNDTRVYQQIAVKPRTTYKISVDIKTENVDESGAGANVSAIGALERSEGIKGTSDWQTVTVYTKTAKNQHALELSLGLGGYGSVSTGKAMFDNLKIERVSAAPSGYEVLKLYKDNSSSSGSSGSSSSSSAGKGLKLLFLTLLIALIIFIIVLGLKTDEKERAGKKLGETIGKVDGKDLIIIAFLTVACSFVSFFRLGDTDMPETYWKSSMTDEYVIVEFDEVTNVCGMAHLSNVPKAGAYSVYYEVTDGEGDYKLAYTITSNAKGETEKEKAQGSFLEWTISKNINFNTKRVKVVSERTGWALNEIGFLTKEDKINYSVVPCRVIDESYIETTDGKPSNLFDEQDFVKTKVTYMNGTYFDEIYHVRTAYEMIKGWNIYETTHPPLGKILISLGIRIFGMNPFGWRFMGTLFGVMMVPLIYLFARKIFKKRRYAILAGSLFCVEFMRLAHSRLATIDSFSTFFILLMYYFMYDYFVIKCNDPKDVKARIPLMLCGISFGLGAATKWTCLYAGAGLALLFFAAELFEAVDTKNGFGKVKMTVKEWFVKRFLPTCGLCVLFFVLIPGAIYTLSYLPYMPTHPNESLWKVMINNQMSMYSYHSNLDATHPYMSSWWSWPLDIRPIWLYLGNSDIGNRATIASFGNPAIWMLSIPALIGTVYYAYKKSDKKMLVIVTAFALEFLPWILVTRCAFIYHYMPCVPFVILMIVYCLNNLSEDKIISSYVEWIYLGIAVILFIIFYPVLTGMEVKESYVESLRWFSTWYF